MVYSKWRRGRRSSSGHAPTAPTPSGGDASPSGVAATPSGAAPSPPDALRGASPSGGAPSPPGAYPSTGPSHHPGAGEGPSTVQSCADTRPFISPVGDSFTDPVNVIHVINRIVNNLWRGDSMSYTSTPDSTRQLWWTEFKRSFTWDPSDEVEIRRIFKKKCGDHIRNTLNHAKTRGKKPPFITDENWVRISQYWESEDSRKRSNQNKQNQACNSGALSATYAGGSINIDEHTRRLVKEMGRDPDFIDTFTRTFQKKDKTWSGDRAKAIKDKYDELELARVSTASSEGDGSEPSVGNDLSLWLEATGGDKGGRRILGMGSLGRTYRAAGSSSITSPAVTSQIHSLTEEVTQLKGLLMQRDEDMRQRDNEMRQREEQMRQRDREINRLRRQQDVLFRHLQLSFPPGDDDDDDDDDDGGGS
ncbi:uncharacterized protein LOC141826436 [Curcuma longa]|uniref:uncharacterized protein LOC141826436 n=2 Tax=Curcuma longa TaxID=136217 RepID=UPI003D9F607E